MSKIGLCIRGVTLIPPFPMLFLFFPFSFRPIDVSMCRPCVVAHLICPFIFPPFWQWRTGCWRWLHRWILPLSLVTGKHSFMAASLQKERHMWGIWVRQLAPCLRWLLYIAIVVIYVETKHVLHFYFTIYKHINEYSSYAGKNWMYYCKFIKK